MAENDKAEVKCLECGWEGMYDELGYKTVYEDYGDVSCLVCPNCKRVDYDGREMFKDLLTECSWSCKLKEE